MIGMDYMTLNVGLQAQYAWRINQLSGGSGTSIQNFSADPVAELR
jgi:hypothetical protein